MINEIEVDGSKNIQKIGKALSSQTRIGILYLTMEKEQDISRIAETLGQTEANISAQVKILEKAGLMNSHYEPGKNGIRKVCKPATKKLIIQIIEPKEDIGEEWG